MYTKLYLEQLYPNQLPCGNVSLNVFILADDNISHIMTNKGGLAKYSQVEMLLGALPSDMKAKAVMKLKLDSRDPSTFKNGTL